MYCAVILEQNGLCNTLSWRETHSRCSRCENKQSLLAKVPMSLKTSKQPEGTTLLRGLGVEMNTLHDTT